MSVLRCGLVAAVAACTLVAPDAHAIRPFVTDDARVVGARSLQLESWAMLDRTALEHNVLLSFGPTQWMELTAGTTHGRVMVGEQRGYSITGPILQTKLLLLSMRDGAWPGIALAGGVLPPLGYGALTPEGWHGFGYLALTESLLDEALMIHANLGATTGDEGDEGVKTLLTAGLGAQIKMVGELHGVVELYYGDPYDPKFASPAAQIGARYIFSEHVQMDATVGSSLVSVEGLDERKEPVRWATLGLRLASSPLW